MESHYCNCIIPVVMYERLQAQCERTGLSRSEVFRRALDAYLKTMEEEWEQYQAFKAERAGRPTKRRVS